MLEKRKESPDHFQIKQPKTPRFSEFRKYAADDVGAYVLAIVFIGCGMVGFLLLQSTLISLLEASQLFIAFGLVGFTISYIVRKPLQLGVLDGLFYNVFGIGPICMVAFLAINQLNNETYVESYRVSDYELHGNRYSFDLENQAYDEFWRIRTIEIESRPARSSYIEFTFADGLLGYKVVKETRLF